MKIICHVTSRNRMVRGICDFVVWHVTPNYKSPFCQVLYLSTLPMFSHKSREKEFMAFLICYMILCDHVILFDLCDFVDNKPALDPTTLSGLVAIGPAEVKI